MPTKPKQTKSTRPANRQSAPKRALVTRRSPRVDGIRSIDIVRGKDGASNLVINLAPHYTVVITGGAKPSVALGYTHHSFVAEAYELNGQLEKVIDHVRQKFPLLRVD